MSTHPSHPSNRPAGDTQTAPAGKLAAALLTPPAAAAAAAATAANPATADRRRPGRQAFINPHLVGVLRKPTAPPAGPEIRILPADAALPPLERAGFLPITGAAVAFWTLTGKLLGLF